MIPNLGELLDDVSKAKRDAVHYAIDPVVSGHVLAPGERIGFLPDGRVGYVADDKEIGIVDPFLRCKWIVAGQAFYMMLFPNTAQNLRHDWDYPPETKKAPLSLHEAHAIIGELANLIKMLPSDIMKAADDLLLTGEKFHMGQNDRYSDFNYTQFWDAYEVIRGVKIDEDERGLPFSCAC